MGYNSYEIEKIIEVRQSSSIVFIDTYGSYTECIQNWFPNLKIITDRFHIIQHKYIDYDEVYRKHRPY